MSSVERLSPCKVNLLLNILGKRPDGFHELETIMCPVAVHDVLRFELIPGTAIELTCDQPGLPADSSNLVHRAATRFFERAGDKQGVRIHLEKRIPLAAGLGGGSANAATTLLALNELLGHPLAHDAIHSAAASLGSDVPFFLQSQAALATGRGENVKSLGALPALKGASIFLFHPGFGVATAWAYQALAAFPEGLNGKGGRANALASVLRKGTLREAGSGLFNSLEFPVLQKHPILRLYQEFLRGEGAAGTLMSGSGSSTFALFASENEAQEAAFKFRKHFGETGWLAIAPLGSVCGCTGIKGS